MLILLFSDVSLVVSNVLFKILIANLRASVSLVSPILYSCFKIEIAVLIKV